LIALVLDPGRTSGAALIEWDVQAPMEVLSTWAIPGGCEGFVDWYKKQPKVRSLSGKPWSIVISELFEIDGTVTGTWSPRIEGALMALWGPQVTWQRRDDKALIGKGEPARNAWLSSRGLHARTQHERDAIVHGLVFLRRLHHRPTIERYWPKP
jgi:hypothetical protein